MTNPPGFHDSSKMRAALAAKQRAGADVSIQPAGNARDRLAGIASAPRGMKFSLRLLACLGMVAPPLLLTHCANAVVDQLQAAVEIPQIISAPAPTIEGATGLASYYRHDAGFTAAHRTLPFGTRVRVTNLSNNRAVTVQITDRGPFIASRVIDLSYEAATAIGMTESGVVRVRVDVLQ